MDCNGVVMKKILTFLQMCANMTIEKGTTDRRLVHILTYYKITVQFVGWGGYFCVLLLSLPNVYPAQK